MSKSLPLPSLRTVVLTVVAMLAFAGNSIFCRLAFERSSIDPASFTLVRIAAGTFVLWLILAVFGKSNAIRGSWRAGVALLIYAGAFSFAYVTLQAGIGALLLFGAVQATMVIAGLYSGNRLILEQWVGLLLALVGLGVLLVPGSAAPSIAGAVLMLIAGVAWGTYSMLARSFVDPLAATSGNFLRALSLAVVLFGGTASIFGANIDVWGLYYGVLSGAAASGLGYTIWYAALNGLSPVQGASVQLSVPVITALAGAWTLDETISVRLSISCFAIVGGIALIIATPIRPKRRKVK